MERSLRATGCDLPLKVIPFDDQLFDLPKNSEWLRYGGALSTLKEIGTHPCHQRYAVMTESGYQYADTDIVFLRNPSDVLADHNGFVATCTQWKLPHYAVYPASESYLRSQSSTWPLRIFNSGQFASEHALYSPQALMDSLSQPEFQSTFFPAQAPWDQPGFNLLVHQSSTHVTNVTLPPHNHPSTWAGDYSDDYKQVWENEGQAPFLVHWAGQVLDQKRPINELFFEFLTRDELAAWKKKQELRLKKRTAAYRKSLSVVGRAVHDVKQIGKSLLSMLPPHFSTTART